jgi:hypothetical protein
MTDPGPETGQSDETPQPAFMPRWVPVLIGVVLVGMAGLAVYTGLSDRDENTILDHVRPRPAQRSGDTPAPPGEPGAGSSLVLHGESGENAPAANEPVQGQARAVVTGTKDGVTAVVRIWARRAMVLNVVPEETMVYVNDLPIGQASQFNTMDEAYEFAAPGSYTVRLVPPAGPERTYIVTAADDAPQDVALIKVGMVGRN